MRSAGHIMKQSLSRGDKFVLALASNVDVFAMFLVMAPLLLGARSLFEPFVRNELAEVAVSFLVGAITCLVLCYCWVLPKSRQIFKRLCSLRKLEWEEFNERQKAAGSLLDEILISLGWLALILTFLVSQVVLKDFPIPLVFHSLSFVAVVLLFSQVAPLLAYILVRGTRQTGLMKQLDDLSRNLELRSPSLRVFRAEDHGYLNAFAFSSNLYSFIVVNKSVEGLARGQREAILAHELVHAKGHHIMITLTLSLLIAALVTTSLSIFFEDSLQDVEVFALLSIGSYFTTRFSSHLMGRHFEKSADVAAARIVGANTYVRLLKTLRQQDIGLGIGGVTRAFMDVHPSPDERIELVLKQRA